MEDEKVYELWDSSHNRTNKSIDVFSKNSVIVSNSKLKNFLMKIKYFNDKCYANGCGVENKWLNTPITLQMDHINGNSMDNRLENLRLLCPNCHSQTSTFSTRKHGASKIKVPDSIMLDALKNSKSIHAALTKCGIQPSGGNYSRIKKMQSEHGIIFPDDNSIKLNGNNICECGGYKKTCSIICQSCRLSRIKTINIKYCILCTKKTTSVSGYCRVCWRDLLKKRKENIIDTMPVVVNPSDNSIKKTIKKIKKECINLTIRKVKKRPSQEELQKLIHEHPMTHIGKMFGVSDNAIRKWCKSYEIEIPKRHGVNSHKKSILKE